MRYEMALLAAEGLFSTAMVGGILAAALLFAARRLWKKRREQGPGCGCGGCTDCTGCSFRFVRCFALEVLLSIRYNFLCMEGERYNA